MPKLARPPEEVWPQHTETTLFAALAAGHLVVTATNRLARELRGRFARWNMEHGRRVWRTPDILPYATWLSRSYQTIWSDPASPDLPRLLTPAQELAVWEDAVQQSPEGRRLLNAGAAARSAREAWQLWQEYCLNEEAIQAEAGPDTEAFLGWAATFRDRCRKRQWLDSGQLPGTLRELVAQGKGDIPEEFTLAGFDLVSPMQQELVQTLSEAGCPVWVLQPQEVQSRVACVPCADARQEMDDAARWARKLLEESASTRIGIVVPNLQAVREDVLEALEAVLEPERLLPWGGDTPSCINVSLGGPVAETAVGRCALGLLRLGRTTFKTEDFGALLRSRHWAGGESEWAARAELEAAVYAGGEPQWTRTLAEFFLARHGETDCPETARALHRFWARLDELPRKQSWSQWAETFGEVLRSVGWPGASGQPSASYQAVEAWQECLEGLEQFDQVLEPAGYGEALQRLEQLARETLFQPESGHHPVQVLGLLEAAGSRFDALWVMGLTDEVWPPAARPHPLLPHALQIHSDMPHCAAQRELRFARQVTHRLSTAAPDVVFSLPQRDGDRELQPSPLLADFPLIARDELLPTAVPSFWEQLGQAAEPHWELDEGAPALAEGTRLRGGTGALKAQALCPFQAFGRFRLQAAAVRPPEPGITALERGNLVHKALEAFWAEMQTRERLQGASAETIAATARKGAQKGVEQLVERRPMTLTGRHRELEEDRLTRLLEQWAARELERTPFAVVEREHRVEASFAGARLRVVCDRVDRLDDGRLAVVDYKTGEIRISDWFAPRLLEPQLPLYALLAETEVAGIFVARIKTGHLEYAGVVGDDQVHSRCRACESMKANAEGLAWPELLEVWRGQLTRLVSEYMRGECAVAPVDENHSCRFCELRSLCRLNDRKRYPSSEHYGVDNV